MSGHISQSEYGSPTILTKQQLKSEAKPRDKTKRSSTDEETPVGVQMPEDSAATDSDIPSYVLPQRNKKYNKMMED